MNKQERLYSEDASGAGAFAPEIAETEVIHFDTRALGVGEAAPVRHPVRPAHGVRPEAAGRTNLGRLAAPAAAAAAALLVQERDGLLSLVDEASHGGRIMPAFFFFFFAFFFFFFFALFHTISFAWGRLCLVFTVLVLVLVLVLIIIFAIPRSRNGSIYHTPHRLALVPHWPNHDRSVSMTMTMTISMTMTMTMFMSGHLIRHFLDRGLVPAHFTSSRPPDNRGSFLPALLPGYVHVHVHVWEEEEEHCDNVPDEGAPGLSIKIEKQRVIHVKNLEWKFRGNQTVVLDGVSIEVFWDVHNWLFSHHASPSPTGSAIFIFQKAGPCSDKNKFDRAASAANLCGGLNGSISLMKLPNARSLRSSRELLLGDLRGTSLMIQAWRT